MQAINVSRHSNLRCSRKGSRACWLNAAELSALLMLGVCLSFAPAEAQTVTVPNQFVNGEIADADEVNANFQALEDAVNTIPLPSNTVVVAKTGGHFDNVADAISGITDAASDNPYLVRVHPGIYDETQAIIVPGFVHLAGSGAGVTVIRRTAGDSSQTAQAAIITLEDGAQLSDLSVENDGTAVFAIGVLGFAVDEGTLVDRVHALVNGAGGTGHFAFLFHDSNVTLRDSEGRAEGASLVNTGFGSTDSGGPFAQPRIERCRLEGNGGSSGFGMQISSTAADVFDSDIFGSGRAISTSIEGISEVHHSVLRSFAAIMEQTGSATVLLAGVHVLSTTNPIGNSSNFKYVHCFKGNYDPIVDGTGSNVN